MKITCIKCEGWGIYFGEDCPICKGTGVQIMDKMTVGSLFAGIGGFDLGFERAGYEISWQVEIDPFCRKVLAKHFPNAKRFEDVKTVGKHNLTYVDVLCGGFPCQDISVAGKGAGITGERSGLWSEFARIIGEIRPRYVVVENVGALLGRGMGRVLGDFSKIGYDAEWRIISARDAGALHLRKRIWIIAYPNKMGCKIIEPSDSAPCNSLRNCEANNKEGKRDKFCESSPDSKILYPNHRQKRVQRFFKEEIQKFGAFSWCQDVGRVEDLRGRSDIPEPLFRGSRDGVPNWVDRIGACGNAVVPQIPEWLANQISQYEKYVSCRF